MCASICDWVIFHHLTRQQPHRAWSMKSPSLEFLRQLRWTLDRQRIRDWSAAWRHVNLQAVWCCDTDEWNGFLPNDWHVPAASKYPTTRRYYLIVFPQSGYWRLAPQLRTPRQLINVHEVDIWILSGSVAGVLRRCWRRNGSHKRNANEFWTRGGRGFVHRV